MITKKAKYALNALLVLALHHGDEPMAIGELANRAGVPKKFLELILLELRKKGILQSRRGKAGGYCLSASPDEVSVGQIIRIMDGPMAPVLCISKTAYRKCEECPQEAACGVRLALKDAYEASLRILEKTTLTDILRKMQEMSHRDEPEPMMFYI